MKIVNVNDKNVIEEAIAVLKNGGIVIYPTETCYGVGVDATNSDAVTNVLEYKKRPQGKPVSIGVVSESMANEFVELNNSAKNIYKNFLPGPVTVISKSKGNVDKRLESEKKSLGIRIPNYPLILKIIKEFGGPITTTSANSSGKKTPYSIQDIFENISEKQKNLIGLIIDAGELPHNPPSTVIDTTTEELTTYRKGDIEILNSNTISKEFISRSIDETIFIGEKIMKDFMNKLETETVVFLLHGDLGVGKTQFVKGIAKALGITENVKSPTYTYVNEYEIQKSKIKSQKSKLFHFDAWKIQSIEDLYALEFDAWFQKGNVIAIEWPSVILNLKKDFLEKYRVVTVEMVELSETERKIILYF
jgi:L-threonylcarbamoyladenylate synthase